MSAMSLVGITAGDSPAATMNLHLAEISRHVTVGSHAVVVLDGAGWHQTAGKLEVPENLSLLKLPPYSPELNPVENIWQFFLRKTPLLGPSSYPNTHQAPRDSMRRDFYLEAAQSGQQVGTDWDTPRLASSSMRPRSP
jgi:hypothetical protein